MKRAISATLSPVRRLLNTNGRPLRMRLVVPSQHFEQFFHRGREFDFVDRNQVAPGNVSKLSAMASAMKQSRKPDIP